MPAERSLNMVSVNTITEFLKCIYCIKFVDMKTLKLYTHW